MVGQGSIRVLIIDSEPRDAELFSEALLRLPYHSVAIETAASGPEGLDKARRTRYDLLFLDGELPGSEGLDVLKALRDENLSQVVLLTKRADARLAVEALKLGALDYIVKADLPSIDLGRLIERALELVRLKRANVELERLNVMKNEFLGIVSQELAAPMTVIVGMATLLLSESLGKLGPEQRRSLEQILEQGRKLSRLNEEFLDLRARTLGSKWLNPKPLSVADLIKEALAPLERMWRSKGVRLSLEPFPEPFFLEADAVKLSDAVAELVSNAVRHTPEGGTVRVRGERVNPGETVIVIEDDGDGIEPDRLNRLFDPEFQAELASGPGVGLTYCKEVIEAHHGRLRVDSAGTGKGTRVSFVLPCPGAQKSPPSNARRVLLVDDNRDVLELLKFLLRRSPEGPLEFLTAATGESAVEIAGKNRVDLILLDVMLSGMDGLEVLEALKKSPQTKAIPVMIMSAFPDVVNRALGLGASAVLIKPFPPDKLLKKVTSLLQAS